MNGLLGVGAVTSIGLGAILTFAVDWQPRGVDRPLVGLIMMAVGAIALAAFVAVSRNRGFHPGDGEYEEHHFYGGHHPEG